MQLNPDQLNRQKAYSATVSILNSMKCSKQISEEDYLNGCKFLVEKYHPILHLNVDYS